ncbi:DUF2203 domain-containing protein [Gemmata sp.]|uniref:DUF2203 domain-containing protein n=1 Tax=Gemmata sp. TaxID=1914242 RepID=UPI003F718110
MSNTPNRATNPAGKPKKKDVALDLTTARQMLPLVKSIVSDIINSRQTLSRLTPEQERLDRHRRDLVWQERQRRYQVRDEIAVVEQVLQTAEGELAGLGVSLIDEDAGEVDFPTKINGRPAAYTWRFGDAVVAHWHYQGEEQLRPIPTDGGDQNMTAASPVRYRGNP